MKKSGYGKLWGGLFKFRPWVVITLIFGNILIFAHANFAAYFIRIILNRIDTGIRSGDGSLMGLEMVFIGLGAVALVRVGAIFSCAVLDNVQKHYYDSLMRNNIIRRLFKKKDIKEVAGKSGKYYEVLDDDISKATYPPRLLAEVTGFAVYTLIAIGTLVLINWKITLFIFIPVSLAIAVISIASDKLKSNRHENRKIFEKVTGCVSDTSQMVEMIKVSNAQESILKHYDKLNKKRLDVVLKETLFQSTVQAVVDSTVYVGTALIMMLVGGMLVKGEFLIGDFSIFIFYLGALSSLIDRVIELITESKHGEVSFERIVDVVGDENKDELSQHRDIRAFTKCESWRGKAFEEKKFSELKISNLSYSYSEEKGIKNVDLNVKKGEIVVVAGEVGSGKSTLLSTIIGINPKDSGSVIWNGEDGEEYSSFMKPPYASFISQVPRLFKGSIRENIVMGKNITKKDIDDAVEKAVFTKDLMKMEKGLETEIGSGGNKLSGGQKQRVSLARMFMNSAGLYLMDDSTSALDENTEKIFWKRFKDNIINKGGACLVASNKKMPLDQADRIIFMKDGSILDSGSLKELIERCGEFRAIYGS